MNALPTSRVSLTLVCVTLILSLSIPTLSIAAAGPRSANFDVRHDFEIQVPEGTEQLRAWFALPQEVPEQKITDLVIEAPYPTRVTTDSRGNRVLFLEADHPEAGSFTVSTRFQITRSEQQTALARAKAPFLPEDERAAYATYLAPSTHVIIDERIEKLSEKIVGDETDSVAAAHKIYDWVLDNIDYWVKDPAKQKASPVGSTDYCLTTKTGNCTDFHSLYASLARAAGIPTRMIYGSLFKTELNGLDVDQSYHCWLEAYAPGVGWFPIDVAVADIYVGDFQLDDKNATLVRRTTADGFDKPDLDKVSYYFGNLEERRVTWSTGRDLTLDPPQAGAPVNALPKAYVEIDDKMHPEKEGWTRKLTYREHGAEGPHAR